MIAQTNKQKKFNVNANVVLQACSKAAMVSHSWEPTSNAAIVASNISPSNFAGQGPQPVVTVTLLAAASLAQSEPYTFRVTATFAVDERTDEKVASVTLSINSVGFAKESIEILFYI